MGEHLKKSRCRNPGKVWMYITAMAPFAGVNWQLEAPLTASDPLHCSKFERYDPIQSLWEPAGCNMPPEIELIQAGVQCEGHMSISNSVGDARLMTFEQTKTRYPWLGANARAAWQRTNEELHSAGRMGAWPVRVVRRSWDQRAQCNRRPDRTATHECRGSVAAQDGNSHKGKYDDGWLVAHATGRIPCCLYTRAMHLGKWAARTSAETHGALGFSLISTLSYRISAASAHG